jgi:dCMP deaminase
MSKPAFDDIFMELAVNLAKRSHCIKRHVGAVLTKDTRIISIGYNGPPAGTHNCDVEFPEAGCPRDSKGGCSLAIHAEQNAILYAVKNKATVEGRLCYVISLFSLRPNHLYRWYRTYYLFEFLCGAQRNCLR